MKPDNDIIGRPWRIVAVTFDDGTKVPVTEDALRRYLETGDDAELGLHMNRASHQLKTSIRKSGKRAEASERASKHRRTNVKREELLAFREAYAGKHDGETHGWKTEAAREFHCSVKTVSDRLEDGE